VSETSTSILRRKAGFGRPPPEIVAMSPEKAFRLAFGRAGRGLQGLGLRLTAFGMERVVTTALVDAAPDLSLVATLNRADGATGVVILDPGYRAALIEAETMGRIAKGAPADRPATRIDALIAGGFTDAALAIFDEIGAELSIAPAVTGYRMGEMLPGPAMLPLVLEDVPFRLFRLGFDFADGARQGAALIALPFEAAPSADAGNDDRMQRDLAATVMAAPAEVRAILTRLKLPLDEVTEWQPGDLVPLPREVLDEVKLVDIDGVPIAGGRLGQVGGLRAVRVRMPEG
jgi:flagellar motor switch protein FliM